MLEFLGIVFLGIILYIWLTCDKIEITCKVNGKEVLHYQRDDDDEENDENI